MRTRFIPASAGNTVDATSTRAATPVYPRWRGEHVLRCTCCTATFGLSPLARGTHFLIADILQFVRFIPAGAGNTPAVSGMKRKLSVYPRWRGEHLTCSCLIFIVHGLSPLARGTRTLRAHSALSDRFIPAGAGNTACVVSVPPKIAVYPRWRGEHIEQPANVIAEHGLSPLARGTQNQPRTRYVRRRFIPAGAGNTRIDPVT